VKPAFEGPERRPVVGWLGRLVPEKGPLEFLKVAARMEEERRTAEFLLAGEGPLKDAVRTMADDLGLRQKITFIFEGVEPEAVLPVMDVFVSTSQSEGLGLAVIEAMACGKPVVATAQGGQFDVVRDGHSGYLYQPGDIDACAARTLSLISNPEAAREMGVNGREIVEEEFDARRVAVKLMEVYEQILNESA
jgi:glycosyltransferase involved in cell wall biosynthesis